MKTEELIRQLREADGGRNREVAVTFYKEVGWYTSTNITEVDASGDQVCILLDPEEG